MTNVLEARGVTFGYRSGSPLLHDWDAGFERGSMTAITGRSGQGKSTLLYLLGLMLTPQAGEILVNGVPTVASPDRTRARLRAEQFGFVFQDAALDSGRSVLDNVTETALYRGASRGGVEAVARDLLARMGVDVPLRRKPGQVSGGQAQRIAIARALLNQPQILLADEPTGNLDPATSDTVTAALRAHAARGATVIVVTHSRTMAEACDYEVRL